MLRSSITPHCTIVCGSISFMPLMSRRYGKIILCLRLPLAGTRFRPPQAPVSILSRSPVRRGSDHWPCLKGRTLMYQYLRNSLPISCKTLSQYVWSRFLHVDSVNVSLFRRRIETRVKRNSERITPSNPTSVGDAHVGSRDS